MAKDAVIAEKVRGLANAYGNAENVLADRVMAADDLIELLEMIWDN